MMGGGMGGGMPGDPYYKTQPCMFLRQGHCPNGANCYFAHSMQELRVPPEMMQMMQMQQRAQKKKEKKDKKEKKKRYQSGSGSDDDQARGGGIMKKEEPGERSMSPSPAPYFKKRKIEDEDF